MSPQQWSAYERGKQVPGGDRLTNMARVFGVPVGYILGNEAESRGTDGTEIGKLAQEEVMHIVEDMLFLCSKISAKAMDQEWCLEMLPRLRRLREQVEKSRPTPPQ